MIIKYKFLFKSGSYNNINCVTVNFGRRVVIKTSLLLPSLMMPTSNCWTSHSRNKERKQRLQTSINNRNLLFLWWSPDSWTPLLLPSLIAGFIALNRRDVNQGFFYWDKIYLMLTNGDTSPLRRLACLIQDFILAVSLSVIATLYWKK